VKSHTRFRLLPKSMTLDDLAEIKKFVRSPPEKNEPILSAAKCRAMILVSRNIRYMRIFVGGSSGRGRQVQ